MTKECKFSMLPVTFKHHSEDIVDLYCTLTPTEGPCCISSIQHSTGERRKLKNKFLNTSTKRLQFIYFFSFIDIHRFTIK